MEGILYGHLFYHYHRFYAGLRLGGMNFGLLPYKWFSEVSMEMYRWEAMFNVYYYSA